MFCPFRDRSCTFVQWKNKFSNTCQVQVFQIFLRAYFWQCPNISIFPRWSDVHRCYEKLDMSICVFSVIWEHLPFFTWISADTVSAACPTQVGSWEIISMFFAAVICDSSVTITLQNTTRPLYFKSFASNSAFFKWQMSISETTWSFAFVVLSPPSYFGLSSCFYAQNFSNFSNSLSTASFSAGIFMDWDTRINLWTKM